MLCFRTGTIQDLSTDELKVACKIILRQLAVLLREPELIFNGWDDLDMDASYAKTW